MRHAWFFLFFLIACGGKEAPDVALFPIGPASIAVERTVAHTYLAEYERALVVRRGRDSTRVQLLKDTGGYSDCNLYQLPGGRLLLADLEASYVIVPESLRVIRDPVRRREGVFLGVFAEDDHHAC